MKRVLVFGTTALLISLWNVADAQQPAPPAAPASPAMVGRELHIKYMRDSEEYATLARQVYRQAGEALARNTAQGGRWAAVLDVDETALDNSTFQLERSAYGLPTVPLDTAAWAAWVQRRRAEAVPGAREFIELVRKSGGHVAWITNREMALTPATRDNLAVQGLWNDDDRLCLQKNPQHTKGDRRREVVTGQGDCGWASAPTRVAVFVGDQLGDFPTAAENIPNAGTDAAFGRTCFLLPNSMYGGWTTRVTRRP